MAPKPPSNGAEEQAPDTEQTQELTVFAAASLNAAFSDIATEVFEPENPGVSVKFSFEGSSTLVDQITNGAPADVFASADQRNMQKQSMQTSLKIPSTSPTTSSP